VGLLLEAIVGNGLTVSLGRLGGTLSGEEEPPQEELLLLPILLPPEPLLADHHSFCLFRSEVEIVGFLR
jgi:hypothetical protein